MTSGHDSGNGTSLYATRRYPLLAASGSVQWTLTGPIVVCKLGYLRDLMNTTLVLDLYFSSCRDVAGPLLVLCRILEALMTRRGIAVDSGHDSGPSLDPLLVLGSGRLKFITFSSLGRCRIEA